MSLCGFPSGFAHSRRRRRDGRVDLFVSRGDRLDEIHQKCLATAVSSAASGMGFAM